MSAGNAVFGEEDDQLLNAFAAPLAHRENRGRSELHQVGQPPAMGHRVPHQALALTANTKSGKQSV